MTALAGDGKLIVLTKNNSIKTQRRIGWPLSILPFYFPVAPAQIDDSMSAVFTEQQVVRRGAIGQFGGPGLRTISFSSEFIDEDWLEADGMPTYVIPPPSGFIMHGARKAKSALREIMNRGLVINLSIQDQVTGHVEVAMPVTIRDLPFNEVGGEPDTRFFSITFAEHRMLRLRNVPRGGVPFVDPVRPGANPGGGRYVSNPYILPRQMGIKTVSLVAYHRKSFWRDIVKANGGTAGMLKKGCHREVTAANGPWICPKGTRLFIPNEHIPIPR